MFKILSVFAFFLIGFLLLGCTSPQVNTVNNSDIVLDSDFSLQLLSNEGGRVDWSHSNNLIAFDKKGSNGFYSVYTINSNGSNETCISCSISDFKYNVGNPAWHPNGKYLIIQVQTKKSNIFSNLSNPGKGVSNDLFLIDSTGTHFWQLTNLSKSRYFYGVLHPHFSHDGNKIVWSELQSLNTWALKVADLYFDNGTPKLQNIKTYQPGDTARFYESHGFTLNDSAIIFSGTPYKSQSTWGNDIFTLNLSNGTVVNLTNTPKKWEEHANLSPDGKTIIYMSSDNPGYFKYDLWSMNINGTNKTKLTHFHDSNSKYFFSKVSGPADSSWNKEGTKIVFYMISDFQETSGKIYVINLKK
ncbi:hypothetical protein COV24_02330 [candidate division WWE3 bacterium CG10_big_fil_rev_8_21_14_0_10_32_10]|uniref:Dipeptidylpeptidase IV N-terminal domain-containing protein n=1 Tax=candidate division WWE3 bacterium CG10_big_fil_rev_8_21_14_0_10_32_10 TaxID=1975090 RepID=A0A2H0RCH8_UNCKA|nr:MAG: hypothetical protein COV24_02330 [candidate division WWE3 bacterium CG10_big_fil_rev_8_21_14_0_10_32_10]